MSIKTFRRENNLLVADANAVSVFEHGLAAHLLPVHLEPVAASEVFADDLVALDEDLRVLTGYERIVDGHLALGAPPEDRLPRWQVELLQQETETVSRHHEKGPWTPRQG